MDLRSMLIIIKYAFYGVLALCAVGVFFWLRYRVNEWREAGGRKIVD